MNGRVIRAIMLKDLREFPRNPYWVIIGPVSLVLLIVSFWMMPDKFPQGVIVVGVYPRSPADSARSAQGLARLRTPEAALSDGLEIVPFESEDRLRAVVAREVKDEGTNDIAIGVAFPDDFVPAVRTGKKTTVQVYLDGSEEMGAMFSSAVREYAYGLQSAAKGKHPAKEFPVALPDPKTITLGEDRGAIRMPGEKRRPVIAVMALFFGLVVLAGLTAVEIEHRTVKALLVTPARVGDFLVAKGLTGVALGSGQALIFLLATWNYGTNWPLTTALVLLGAIMTSAAGMIAGAAGKGFAMTLFYGIVLIVPLMFPVGSVVHHDSASLFVRAIPSYGIIKGLVGATVYGQGWSDLAPHLATALVWDVVLLGVGLFVLKRRVEAL
jgi:ABC-2 type transport system permease protein